MGLDETQVEWHKERLVMDLKLTARKKMGDQYAEKLETIEMEKRMLEEWTEIAEKMVEMNLFEEY